MGAGSIKRLRALPSTLDGVVTALCADYGRREEAIRDRSVSPRTAMEYKYINHNIFIAAAEIVTEKYARVYIDEIGRKLGYAASEHDAISEAAYKNEKKEVKISIAKRLHLLD